MELTVAETCVKQISPIQLTAKLEWRQLTSPWPVEGLRISRQNSAVRFHAYIYIHFHTGLTTENDIYCLFWFLFIPIDVEQVHHTVLRRTSWSDSVKYLPSRKVEASLTLRVRQKSP